MVGAPTRVRVVALRETKMLARRLERERIERVRAEEGEGGESEIELGGGKGLFGDGEGDEDEEEDELIPNPASSRGVVSSIEIACRTRARTGADFFLFLLRPQERAWINAICHDHPEAEIRGFQK